MLGEFSTYGSPTSCHNVLDIHAKLEALAQIMNQDQDKLGRVGTRLENHNKCEELDPNRNEHEEEHDLLTPYQRRNAQDPDDIYLSIQLDVPIFDNRLNYLGSSDLKFF